MTISPLKLILPLLLFCGCAQHEMAKPKVSLMPWFSTPARKSTLAPAKLAPTQPTLVTVTWLNHPNAWASNIVTGLELSYDLVHWRKLTELPYAQSNSITLTFTNAWGFFRAYNRALSVGVVLMWDEVPDATVEGYRIYTGVMSRSYTNFLPVEPKTNTSAVVSPLVIGTTYYFAATSFNTVAESDFSGEISYTAADFHTPPFSISFAACTSGTEGTKGKRM